MIMDWIGWRYCLRLLILLMLFKCSKAEDDDESDHSLLWVIAIPAIAAIVLCRYLCCEENEDDSDSDPDSENGRNQYDHGSYHFDHGRYNCDHESYQFDHGNGNIEIDQSAAAPAVLVEANEAGSDVGNSGDELPTPSMRLVEPLPPPTLNAEDPPSYYSLFPAVAPR